MMRALLRWVKSKRAFTFETDPAAAFLRPERLEDFRPHGGTALRLTATVPGLPSTVLADGPADVGSVLGPWSHGPLGLSYEVTVPPIGVLLGSDFAIGELVTWVARHMVTRVRQALAGQAPAPTRRHRWPTAGMTTATAPPPSGAARNWSPHSTSSTSRPTGTGRASRRTAGDETARSVTEGASVLQTDEEGAGRLADWVADRWQAQLDVWHLYGEPVFWCDHIDEDEDEQPLMEWFMRFPAAVTCDKCAALIRQHMVARDWPATCSSCGKQDVDTAYARTPGMSIIASYELCETCSAAFTPSG